MQEGEEEAKDGVTRKRRQMEEGECEKDKEGGKGKAEKRGQRVSNRSRAYTEFHTPSRLPERFRLRRRLFNSRKISPCSFHSECPTVPFARRPNPCLISPVIVVF